MSQIVSSGQTVSGATVSGQGNTLTVEQGGTIQNVTVVAGGVVSESGEDHFLVVSSGGTFTVDSAGSSYNATVLSGGLQTITNGVGTLIMSRSAVAARRLYLLGGS